AKRSAGLGLRWLSPVGPIRIDFAHPFDSEDSFRVHVTMGPDL
ncbi:MAG: BamA/TamA family outer membrane protein, partial [Pseudomonadales bacterium]|nr:BamA/TamA family outer membrane protein [Pseudomonadales bacterium]